MKRIFTKELFDSLLQIIAIFLVAAFLLGMLESCEAEKVNYKGKLCKNILSYKNIIYKLEKTILLFFSIIISFSTVNAGIVTKQQAMQKAQQFLQGKSLADLESDVMLRYAVVKCLEIIGEAAYMLTLEFKDQHPQTLRKGLPRTGHQRP